MTTKSVWVTAMLLAAGLLGQPAPAAAQGAPTGDGWNVSIAPLYLWASELDGSMAIGPKELPVFMDFGSVVKNLSATFTFNGEVHKGRWGAFVDVGFVRLGSDAAFELPGAGSATVPGRLELVNTVVETGASARLTGDIAVIGGVRTYTFSPSVTISPAGLPARDVDASKTNVDGFGGATWRPHLSPKVTLLTRGDIGGGHSNLTWSGLLAIEYRMKPALGLLVGYRALGIDSDNPRARAAGASSVATAYDVTHYGPIFAGTFHWGR